MNELGPEAESLFEAGRNAAGLPGPKRARIKQAVLLQAATLGAASTVAGGAVAMSMAAKVTLVTVTAAVLGGGSVSVWAWRKHEQSMSPSKRTVPAQTQVRVASAKPPVLSPVIDEPALVPAQPPRRVPPRSEPRRVVAQPLPVGEVRTKTLPVSESPREEAIVEAPGPAPESLESELTLLRQAQEDLRRGQPAQALRRLRDFDRLFPKARLDQERQAIEAIAGCQVHPGPAATARAQRFVQQAPLSPLAARVRSACKQDEGKSFNETGARREP